MFLSTNIDKKPLLPTIETVVKALFHDPSDVFFSGKAMDVMFNGIPFDCTGDKLASALCVSLDSELAFKRINESHLVFSLFGGVS